MGEAGSKGYMDGKNVFGSPVQHDGFHNGLLSFFLSTFRMYDWTCETFGKKILVSNTPLSIPSQKGMGNI